MADVMLLVLTALTTLLIGTVQNQNVQISYDQSKSVTSCSKGLLHNEDTLMITVKVYEKQGHLNIFVTDPTILLCRINISYYTEHTNGSCYYQINVDSESNIFVNIKADTKYSEKYVHAIFQAVNGKEFKSKEIILPYITDSRAYLEINGQNIDLLSSKCIVSVESQSLNVKYSKLGNIIPKWVQMSVSNPTFLQIDRDVVIFHHNYDSSDNILVKLKHQLCAQKEIESSCTVFLGKLQSNHNPIASSLFEGNRRRIYVLIIIALLAPIFIIFILLVLYVLCNRKWKSHDLYAYKNLKNSLRMKNRSTM